MQGTHKDLVCEVSRQALESAWRDVEAIASEQKARAWVKRVIDLPCAMLGLAATGPVVLTVAVGLALDLREAPFIRQQRAGRLGRPFGLLKLKTMRTIVDDSGVLLPNDQRRSRLGELVRKFSIDELPQLWNVLVGDLSLVGPRPLWQEYVPFYRLGELARLSARPGITGLAQVSGRNTVSWDERFALDVEYCRSTSLLLDDVVILIRTVAQTLRVAETAVDQTKNLVAVRSGGSFSPPLGYRRDRCAPEHMAPSVRHRGRGRTRQCRG